MLARLILLLLVAVPAMALAASDPPPTEGPATVTQPADPALAADAAPTPVPQPAIQSAVPPPADPAACRISCAQTYYFCNADSQGGDCGETWSQCVSTCNSPSLDPNAAPRS